MLSREERITREQEIKKVFSEGEKYSDGRLLVAYIIREEGKKSRAAFVVGQKIGGAVKRNRVRRRLREAFRKTARQSGFDAVFVPRLSAKEASFAEIVEAMEKILKSAGVSE